MTYQAQAALAADGPFYARTQACTQEQAAIFTNDGRPDIASLADRVLADPGLASWFTWPLAVQPGFGDAYAAGGSDTITDPQLLAAVQTVWPTVAAVHPEPTP